MFHNRSAVCQGYTLAFKILMDRQGIDCVYVSSEEMNHGWNMVKVGDSWYHLDVGWGDPTTDIPGLVSRRYLLKSDEEYLPKHYSWTTEYSIQCGQTFENTAVSRLADLPVTYWNGGFYGFIQDGDKQALYRFSAGSDFALEETGQTMKPKYGYHAVTIDEEHGFLYGNVYINSNGGLQNWIYTVELGADTWQENQYRQVNDEEYMGILIQDNQLWLRGNYANRHRFPLLEPSVLSTDTKMPVVLSYPANYSIDRMGELPVSVSSSEIYSYRVFLVCYDANGRMLSATAVAAGNGTFTVPMEALANGTAKAKLLTVGQNGVPLSSCLELG